MGAAFKRPSPFVPMAIYTIGFTRKSARTFFTVLKDAGVRRLLDIRLNNLSQLAGDTRAAVSIVHR